jgi:hypothetical protein
LARLKGNVEEAASIASDLERQLAAKSSGCTLSILSPVRWAKALLAAAKARLTSLNDENKSLGWTGWRGSREEAISELALLGHDVATTIANADLAFSRLKNATGGLDKVSATCQ